MKPIPYRSRQRWADAYQGWRDGRASIPARLPATAPAGPATTPHREALIRQAQDAFGYEHLQYRRAVADAHRRIVAEQARLEAAQANLAWTRLAVELESGAVASHDVRRRRLGEEHHPETVIVQRRLKEQDKLRDRARLTAERATQELSAIESALAEARQEADQHHQAAVVRVTRIHEYTHRRLAVYRRALIRAHPDGAWANAALSVRAPEIPGWALPDAYLPGNVSPPPAPTPDATVEPEHPDEAAVREITLDHRVTHFGSEDRIDERGRVGYVVLTAAVAAPRHFTVIKKSDALELRTYGHGHGPFMDGEPVGRALLKQDDFFDFASHRYTVLDLDRLQEAPLGICDLVVDDLFAKSDSKVRLSHMSFVQRQNTLLAVLGPSGAGKSSLFKALLGELPLESGRLFFRKMPMATHAKQIRAQMGFVPQDTDLHRSLTVLATLRYGFGLRNPADRRHRDEIIDRVIDQLNLEEQRDQLLSTLSGGQLRRVSIALELLTDPPLLLLDEPTSGLDANMDRQVMKLLRDHAEKGLNPDADGGDASEGHTVILVTHATENLFQAHQALAVVNDGAPAYSGQPSQIRRHFHAQNYADLLDTLFNQPREWAERYRDGHAAREAEREASRVADLEVAEPSSVTQPSLIPQRPLPKAATRKFVVLLRRQWVLLATRGLSKNSTDRDISHWFRNGLIVSMPLWIAAISSVLAAVVASSPGLGAKPSGAGPTALSLLTTLCVLSGQALTYSDVVNELEIIRREFRAGVGAFHVLATKWLVYAVVAVGQAGLITAIFCLFPHRAPQRSLLAGPETDLFFGLAALTVAAMTLGLLLSALASKLEQAVALVTATSIAQIALNGVTAHLDKFSVQASLAAVLPDRWGLAAAASSIDLRGIDRGQVSADALWRHTSGQWAQDLIALAGLSVLFFALATWRLHAKLRPKRRSKHWFRNQQAHAAKEARP